MATGRDLIKEVGERFVSDVAEHAIEVLRDEGVYRHVRFRRPKPKSGFDWFELVTWPNCLAINGDYGSYLFSRMEDMFQFFRCESGWNLGRINPQYWSEKLRASAGVEEYSKERFVEVVNEEVEAYTEEYPGLLEAVQRDVLSDDEFTLDFEDFAREAARDFSYLPESLKGQPDRAFRFTDVWEWDLKEWDFHFLWCCHAIQWGIAKYDAERAASPRDGEQA